MIGVHFTRNYYFRHFFVIICEIYKQILSENCLEVNQNQYFFH